ncbi:ABC-type Fe3+/spermidine/putrescine transport system ATPase subunit [Bradyrhizobium sp. JR1.5]|uniref:ABC transporter ATP-binding protein n=1 Tax=unclassified Bradyrhizobium TaxID=2631580 RepID=UPI003393F363
MRAVERETIVSFRNLRKDYGTVTVVPDFSLEIRRGELVCLLGPSGCGKTTTLRMLAGFIQPTRGEIMIEDEDVTYVPAYRRDVGIVFQNYTLFPHMTVAKNVEYGLTNIGMKRQERSGRVQDMLRRVELQHLTRFVAEFIGRCTLLEGDVVGHEFRTEGGLTLPACGPPRRATAVIRPENVKKSHELPGVLARQATIEGTHYHGAVTRLQLSAKWLQNHHGYAICGWPEAQARGAAPHCY